MRSLDGSGCSTNLAEVVGRAAATADQCHDAVALEKFLEVALHGVDERLVRWNLQFSVQKSLHSNA